MSEEDSVTVREPTVAEIAHRQERMEREQRDQWQQIHATRDRVAAAEAGMERLWGELHAFRTESREDARQVTEAIGNLGQSLSNKADAETDNWRRRVDEALMTREGSRRLARWLLGLGIPAIAAIATTAYYLGEIL
jgi:septal ring factor EnvC (AmiA/AmiB activator)